MSAPQKLTRAQRLRLMRHAGFENDRVAFTRAFIGSRIALGIAEDEFAHGRNLRARARVESGGVPSQIGGSSVAIGGSSRS